MGYTCERCNGNGIINYDSDLPRYKQEHCPDCGGEGVLYERKNFQEIADELRKAENEHRQCMLEPLATIGMDDEEFYRYIQGIEKQVESEVFTLRVQGAEENEKPYVQCLIVFKNKTVLEAKLTTKDMGKHLQVQAKGSWL